MVMLTSLNYQDIGKVGFSVGQGGMIMMGHHRCFGSRDYDTSRIPTAYMHTTILKKKN